jgi:peptidoglycan/LPS O-acetylase OafA/YrhL
MHSSHEPQGSPGISSRPFFRSDHLPNQIAGGGSLSIEEQSYIFVPVLLLTSGLFVPVRRQYMIIVALLLMLPLVCYLTLIVSCRDYTGHVSEARPASLRHVF